MSPWYYSVDFLNIEFWSDSSAIAALLPTGLQPQRVANGHCNAFLYHWHFGENNEEYLDPARCQYREFFILADALYGDSQLLIAPTPSSTTMPQSFAAGLRLSNAFRPDVSDQVLQSDPKSGAGPALT